MNNIDIGGCYPPRPYNPSDHTLACENIRFSSLFVAEDVSRETSSATKSEEKRMFSQANQTQP